MRFTDKLSIPDEMVYSSEIFIIEWFCILVNHNDTDHNIIKNIYHKSANLIKIRNKKENDNIEAGEIIKKHLITIINEGNDHANKNSNNICAESNFA